MSLTRLLPHAQRVAWSQNRPLFEPLEARLLLSESSLVSQLPVPYRSGQSFVVEDYDNKVTQNDMGFNYFMGNCGEVGSADSITVTDLAAASNGSVGGSLRVTFDFSGQPAEGPFGGIFHSLFGLTDTLVSLDGTGTEPGQTTQFPGYFLDSQDVFRGVAGYEDRSVESLQFDLRLESAQPIILKVELKDEEGVDVYARCLLSGTGWQTYSLSLPGDFTQSTQSGGVAAFDWTRVSTLSLIVEHLNVGDGVYNPGSGAFLLDNIRLVDADGQYPDWAAMRNPGTGALREEYSDAFLDQVRELSFQYFCDFASTDPRTGGIIQDRSTFADLMTVGGAGFQMCAYIVGAERGYISRADAAARTQDILEVLYDHPMGSDRVGTIGYKGFFYHFLGIDGLRKQNFDFDETVGVDESRNTVELSVIDTALALAGALTAAQYYTGTSADEVAIRALAEDIYERVDWTFMYNADANQFYLGWKPTEDRYNDDVHGRFLLNDADGLGQYSSRSVDGQEMPATLDYYTDEAVLVALLAIASPTHPVPPDAFYGPKRDTGGGSFVRTYPGSLFTYQFGSIWLDTESLQADAGSPPLDYFVNTTAAIDTTRDYAISNPLGRATWQDGRGAWLWGLSACEGPFDQYLADAAPPAALATGRPENHWTAYEGEDGTGDGEWHWRDNASGLKTQLLDAGEARYFTLELPSYCTASFEVRYSNDNYGPLETVTLSVDGNAIGSFQAHDTGDWGAGWNVFESSGVVGRVSLAAGSHVLEVTVSGGDGNGVEIDKVDVSVALPLETGTVTAYAIGSAVPYMPAVATESLWQTAQQDLNDDGESELLHSRFGFADAFNYDIGAAAVLAPSDAKRTTGPWADMTGFAIDHGPMLLLIDNYLGDAYDGQVGEQMIPRLFMSDPRIDSTLASLFPHWTGLSPLVTSVQVNNSLAQRSSISSISFQFSEHVTVGDVAALRLRNDTTGQDIALNSATLIGSGTSTVTWNLAGVTLPDGRYTGTLSAAGVADDAGNPLNGGTDYTFTFHRLAGDATGDAKVNVFDLLKVRQNYLLPPGGGRDDNADVTGDGAVNIFDLLLVRQNYLRELAQPSEGLSGEARQPLQVAAPSDGGTMPAGPTAEPINVASSTVIAPALAPPDGSTVTDAPATQMVCLASEIRGALAVPGAVISLRDLHAGALVDVQSTMQVGQPVVLARDDSPDMDRRLPALGLRRPAGYPQGPKAMPYSIGTAPTSQGGSDRSINASEIERIAGGL